MMQIEWKKKSYVPDGTVLDDAVSRTTHLAIGAHHDDLEIFAIHGILAGYYEENSWFSGVTVTDGAGSARSWKYASTSDDEMKVLRAQEQVEASEIGRYSFQTQLGLPSSLIKQAQFDEDLIFALANIIRDAGPKTLYLHNPADKHPTHIAVLLHCVEALKRLPKEQLPEHIYGCEVWRGLDWLADEEKVALSSGQVKDELPRQLIDVFKSQIEGGKQYSEATLGRRLANATFFQSHKVDQAELLTYAMDLTPLFEENGPTLRELVASHLEVFAESVLSQLPE